MVVPAFVAPASAHELRPAYLELREERPGEFSVLWKTPMRGEMRLGLMPEFSGRMECLTAVATRHTGEAEVQTWRLRAAEPLRGQSVRIAGLERTMTDALVRLEFADGRTWVKRLTAAEPAARIPVLPSGWLVAGEYLELGVEHILTGMDHLLFVLALISITRGGWKLVKTVTAFTVSHSITLSLAALGYLHVPQQPVEAVIALSIVFVATEMARMNGRPTPDAGRAPPCGATLTARAPWLVALTFGLLHGLGFAGALSEVGLPEGHVPVALLFFSAGVEAGHLLFVGAVLGAMVLAARVSLPAPRWACRVPPYAIGIVATFWLVQRVAGF